ncbi:concanavalin A-like lectin/glucanase domain-containing protein [Chaetomium fimeti]|uniref:chitinase n=1 Tax=Chaetomium fimeti TaxID=1854472 RepID=A0AAE0H5J2_9PEZI|nr:concanavalin A-like lectin/glucanase domain-containing protein [Chaetomium fimeti]
MWLPSVPASAVALLAWSSLVGNAAAQVSTDCFPMNKTCPPNPAFGMEANFNFNSTPNIDIWETTVRPVTYDSDNGAGFRITNMGDSPTIRSKFYYFWGRTEVHLKASKGTGVISSIMMLSDNLDEIDWEFFGGNETIAQSNYFGKGFMPDVPNAEYHQVAANVQEDFHNYTTIWTKDFLDFYIDGGKVRRLVPDDANNTYYYPQTPMRLSIGIWAGGDPRMPKGTREWAGGDTDYSQGPFDMFVKSAYVEDYSSGKEYEYTDKTGSWESIKVIEGNSTVKEVMNAPPEKSLSEKWNDLPNGSKIAIYASVAGFFGLLLCTGLFYCIRQRRRGAREAKAAEARAEAERLELERFRKAGVDPDSFASQAHEYNAKEMRRDGFTDEDGYSVPGTPNLHATTPASPLDHRWDSAAASALGVTAAGGAAAAGAAAGNNGPHSPIPRLGDRAQSPRIASPGPGSPGSLRSPTQPNRSYTSPRMGSPGPGYQQLEQPQRSFTTDGGYGGDGAAYEQDPYGNGGQGARGNDAYWGSGNGNGSGGYNR